MKYYNGFVHTYKPKRVLVWAYGSNLCIERMRERCPSARPLKRLVLDNGQLLFRGVADVTMQLGAMVAGGLWSIAPEDEPNLDRFEGVGTNVYMKRYLKIQHKGRERTVLFYQMKTKKGIMPPTGKYLDTIVQGYEDFGLDIRFLEQALKHAWDNKELTQALYDRRQRQNFAPYATPDHIGLYRYRMYS